MQKPFNAEELDLSFLFDASYPKSSITEVNNVATASTAMSGFTPDQTSSLQRMISTSIGEALEPLLRPRGDSMNARNPGPQSLPFNPSSTRISPSESGYEIQPSTADGSQDQLTSTGFIKPLAPKPVPAKRKANATDEAVIFVAKKNCPLGLVWKKNPSEPDLKGYSPESQVKNEAQPGTWLSEIKSSSTRDHASIFLSPAPSQSGMKPTSSQSKAVEESSADTRSMEGQQHLVDVDVEELRPSRENQSEAWSAFADSSAALKTLFRDEPRTDKPCPTKDYFAEKPASLMTSTNVYERSFLRLPSSAPLGCAHIINTSTYQNRTKPFIRVADIVVTFLFNYCPELLYAFLNVTRHPAFIFTRVEAPGSGRRDFSIERSDLTVTCTLHEPKLPEEIEPVEEEVYDEEALIKQSGAIGYGKMEFVCEMKPWGKWVTKSWSSGSISQQVHDIDSRRTIERYSHAFGVFIFKSGMWKEGEGVTFEGGATNA